jgi:glycosyltransferase involved in cell wall biosynthesis
MKSDPEISFICSAYNRPWMLPVALHCLRGNTDFTDWECIVTDNSKDKETRKQHRQAVAEMSERWGDKRYKYLYTADKIAVSDCYYAAEYAIERCRGKYVHLLCDDGYLAPYFAAKMVGAANRNGWDLAVLGKWVFGPETFGGDDYVDGTFGPHTFVAKMGFIFRRDKFKGFNLPKKSAPILADRMFTSRMMNDPGIRWGVVHERMLVHN